MRLARHPLQPFHCCRGFSPDNLFHFTKSIPAECFGHFERLHLFSGLTINFLEEATHPLPWLDRYLPNLSRHLSLRPIWLALDDWIRTGWSATNRSFGCIFQSSRLQFPLIWKPRQHPVGENTDISTNTKLWSKKTSIFHRKSLSTNIKFLWVDILGVESSEAGG